MLVLMKVFMASITNRVTQTVVKPNHESLDRQIVCGLFSSVAPENLFFIVLGMGFVAV